MLIDNLNRLELESKVLAAALKQSIDHGDLKSADFAHKQLFRLLRNRHHPERLAPNYQPPSKEEAVAKDGYQIVSPSLPVIPKVASDRPPVAENAVGTVASTPVTPVTPITYGIHDWEDFTAASSTTIDVYEVLDLPPNTSIDGVHTNFLRKVRKILGSKTRSKGVYPRKSLESLRKLWIAHDILTDPSIRKDYDANVLRWRNGMGPPVSAESNKKAIPEAASLRIGELLKIAGFLDQTELDIACDMHRAMPELRFGRFLVRQDFIEEHQLEAALQGQRFLRMGVIDLERYKDAMEKFKESGKSLDVIMLESGYITDKDLTTIHHLVSSEGQVVHAVNDLTETAKQAVSDSLGSGKATRTGDHPVTKEPRKRKERRSETMDRIQVRKNPNS
jgi:hypothetical protein